MQEILSIVDHFDLQSPVESIRPYGNGNVNDTYLVTCEGGGKHAILQRVNTYVFTSPETVMANMRRATEHLSACAVGEEREWKVQQVLSARNGLDYWRREDGTFWRMISFIENTESFDALYSHHQAYEVGYALGAFHEQINRLPGDAFETVLEGFHVSPGYLAAFDRAHAISERAGEDELEYAYAFIATHRHHIERLEKAKAEGILPLRTIHGDPKVNNILFDKTSSQAISVIDLDTIQPGLVHYDIGDCIRSSCNPLGEEPGVEWANTVFDPESFRHVLEGYMERGRLFLSPEECDYIYDAIFLMAFELGLRFLADYLQGDVYYKIHYPTQNKYRALTQFRLAESIEEHRSQIVETIEKMKVLCS